MSRRSLAKAVRLAAIGKFAATASQLGEELSQRPNLLDLCRLHPYCLQLLITLLLGAKILDIAKTIVDSPSTPFVQQDLRSVHV